MAAGNGVTSRSVKAFQLNNDSNAKERKVFGRGILRGRKKALYNRERGSLDGSHVEAEIQRKALRREKNLAFGEETCLEKERVRSKGPQENWKWH